MLSLITLKDKRRKLMIKFAQKCVANNNTSHIFPFEQNLEVKKKKIKVPFARTERLRISAIPSMARLLNEAVNEKIY